MNIIQKKSWARTFTVAVCAANMIVTVPYPAGATVVQPCTNQGELPRSLKAVPIPEPNNLYEFVADKQAAIALGKALLWDMQVGSDGVQACASCHFSAGADIRSKNQMSPGLDDLYFPLGSRPDSNVYPFGDVLFGNPTVFGEPGNYYFGPNYTATIGDFPYHQRVPATFPVPRPSPGSEVTQQDIQNEAETVLRDTNDSHTSMGVRLTTFLGITPGSSVDKGRSIFDPVFSVNGRDLRRAEPRNAPTMVNSVFNFDNFWEGRASAVFNGVNPFGFRDIQSQLVRLDDQGIPQPVFIRIPNGSLASQAVGPPLSNFEMSFQGRDFPSLARKLLVLKPLAGQKVADDDSVLGPWADTDKGLTINNYSDMIKQAFKPQWWNSSNVVTAKPGTRVVVKASRNNPRTFVVSPGQPLIQKGKDSGSKLPKTYSQMEWNFSLFWGLAVQLYEATLVADNTPFDQFMGTGCGQPDSSLGGIPAPNGNYAALTPQEKLGLDIFMGVNAFSKKNHDADGKAVDGRCDNCHRLPEFTNHSVRNVQVDLNVPDGTKPWFATGVPQNIIEAMVMGNGQSAFYDNGMYNISVRRTFEDIARASTAPDAAPFRNPQNSNQPFPLSYSKLGILKANGLLPSLVDQFVPPLPQACPNGLFADDQGNCVIPPPPLDGSGSPRIAVKGAFKAATVRSTQYTGPFFHNGSVSTLRQVVEFYTRGGNFPATNFNDFDPDIRPISGLNALNDPFFDPNNPPAIEDTAEGRIRALVAFISHGLVDKRVVYEQAPFDHPQLLIPNGSPSGQPSVDNMIEIPAVGQNGHLNPIPTFMNLNQQKP